MFSRASQATHASRPTRSPASALPGPPKHRPGQHLRLAGAACELTSPVRTRQRELTSPVTDAATGRFDVAAHRSARPQLPRPEAHARAPFTGDRRALSANDRNGTAGSATPAMLAVRPACRRSVGCVRRPTTARHGPGAHRRSASASTARPSSPSVTSRASAMRRTVVHVGFAEPRSIRAYAVTVKPAACARSSCVWPRCLRSRRSAWARAASGVAGADTRPRTLLATASLVQCASYQAVTYRCELPYAVGRRTRPPHHEATTTMTTALPRPRTQPPA